MKPEMWIAQSGIQSVVNAFFISRFLSRTLGAKHHAAVVFTGLLLFDCIYGAFNGIFHIAGTILANTLYFCIGFFLVYTFLFHGRPLKRLYFTVFVWCSYGIMYHILLPFNFVYANKVQTHSLLFIVAINVVVALFQGILLEYIGLKFHNLRNDLPTSYIVYLLLMTAFVYAAVIIMAEYALTTRDEASLLTKTLHCAFFSAIGMTVTVWGVLSVDRHMVLRLSEQRYHLQAEHFKSKEQYYRQLARLRHDIKNHLVCLDSLLREEKIEQAATYLKSLTKLTADTNKHIFTGNDFADAILNEKYAEALSNNVKFTVDARLPAESPIDPIDISCILSNTLDNAIQAASQTNEKRIGLWAFSRQSQLVIEIKNDLSEPVNNKNSRILSKDPAHGIGLESVRGAIEKYGGVMDIASDERSFTFSAMLPLE